MSTGKKKKAFPFSIVWRVQLEQDLVPNPNTGDISMQSWKYH